MIKKLLFPILLILLSCIPLLDWFHPGFPITHDGQDHIARIANFYQSLTDGILVPRWAENLNWGYGHPILMFLYPLPSYTASLFHFVGLSFVDSTKAVFIIAFILSGLTMYLWCQEFLPEEAAFAGGLAYTFAPYRFVDLSVRGAIGEHVALIFPPLVLYFLLKLSKKINSTSLRAPETISARQSPKHPKHDHFFTGLLRHSFLVPRNDVLLGSLSLALLILAHNAISLMFIPIILVYALYLLFQTKHKISFILNTVFLILWGFLLSAFFWAPALLEGKYTLRDIVTGNSYAQSFSAWSKFIFGPWSYGGSGQLSVQVGILQWLAVLAAIPATIFFFRKKKSLWFLSGGGLIIFLFTLFLMNSSSNFLWQRISLIQKFQFPWRFLSVTVFITGLLAALVLVWMPKKFRLAATIIFAIGLLIQNSGYWHAKGYQYKPESFYSGIYHGTTDTGESAPIWSIRFMEHTPKAHIEVIHGTAQMTETKRTSVDHQYTVSSAGRIQLRENTLYFPGWVIKVDSQPVSIQYQDPNNRGLMTFFVDAGTHHIDVHFGETKLREIADYTSLFAALILIITASTSFFLSKQQKVS